MSMSSRNNGRKTEEDEEEEAEGTVLPGPMMVDTHS